MIVRPATREDAEAIAAIQNPVIRDTSITFNAQERSADDIAKAMEGWRCTLVAEDDGVLLGFACYFQFRAGIGYARTMEHTIVLAPEARGKGVGRRLMADLEDKARAAGVGSLWAGVSGENPDGLAFHLSLGFEEIARLPKVGYKFGRWMDLILLRKWLENRE